MTAVRMEEGCSYGGEDLENNSLAQLRSYPSTPVEQVGVVHINVSPWNIGEKDREIQAVYRITAPVFCRDVCTKEQQEVFRNKFHLNEDFKSADSKITRVMQSLGGWCCASLMFSGVGALFGLFGGFMQYSSSSDSSSAVLGKGAGIGAGIGACFGACFGALITLRFWDIVATTDEFRNWQENKVKELYDLYVNFAQRALSQRQIKNITGYTFLPSIPVRPIKKDQPPMDYYYRAGQYIYDREEVIAHLTAIANRVTGEARAQKFTAVFPKKENAFEANDLRYAFVFARDVVSRLSSYYKREYPLQQHTTEMTPPHQAAQRNSQQVHYVKAKPSNHARAGLFDREMPDCTVVT